MSHKSKGHTDCTLVRETLVEGFSIRVCRYRDAGYEFELIPPPGTKYILVNTHMPKFIERAIRRIIEE
jgi:hypothetical protein